MTRADHRKATREANRIAADMAGVEDYNHAKRSVRERERLFRRFQKDLLVTDVVTGWCGKVGGP